MKVVILLLVKSVVCLGLMLVYQFLEVLFAFVLLVLMSLFQIYCVLFKFSHLHLVLIFDLVDMGLDRRLLNVCP